VLNLRRRGEKGFEVAYQITLFVRTSEPVAQRVAGELVSRVAQRNPSVTGVPTGDGVGWSSYDLTTGRDGAAQLSEFERDLLPPELGVQSLSVAVTTRPDSVKDQIAWGLENGGPPSLAGCDGFVTLTLVGYVHDWDLVELVCDVATERWDAIMCDDHDGFDLGQ
jgi:hypothetical protein